MDNDERRKFPRVEQNFRINYTLPGSPNSTSDTIDISAGGIAFKSEKKISDGTVIKLHLKSSKQNEQELIGLSLIAKVVQHQKNDNGYRIGAEFMYVTKKTSELLGVYLYPEPELN